MIRTIYHESLGDIPSRLMEICGWAEMSSVAAAAACCLLLLLATAAAAAAAAACCYNIFSPLRPKKGCKTDLVNQLGDPNPNPTPNQDFILGPSWLMIS